MGKEAVCIFALLLAIFVVGAITVETGTRETAEETETPSIELEEEITDYLCSIAFPDGGQFYSENSILLEILANKTLESIKYRDYKENNSEWKTLCTHCKGYNKEKMFEEGFHRLIIKCRDSSGREDMSEVEFFNDYTNPRISRLKPSSGFTNGADFRVKYTENNVKSVLFWVRKAAGTDKPKVELFVMARCPFCQQAENGLLPVIDLLKGKIDFKIRLAHFMLHGEEEKKETYRQVCIREEQPEKYLDYLKCFVKEGDYATCLGEAEVNTRELDECFFNRAEGYYAEDANLSEAYGIEGTPTLIINGVKTEFSDRSSANSMRLICSQLNKVPEECFHCLSSQNPFPGFGEYDAFECESAEALGDWVQKQCTSGKNQECSFYADLSEYDGEEVEYFFAVRDLGGNIDVSRPVKVRVDTTAPVLNNPLSFWEQGSGRDRRFVYFNFNITEENFDKITYSYEDSKGREKHGLLCSSLRGGFCTKRKSFLPGDYELTIEILDKAGNSEEEEIEFMVE